MNRSQKCICAALILLSFVGMIPNVTGYLQEKPLLKPGDTFQEYFRFSEKNEVPFILKTQGNMSIWFLNETEFGNYLILGNASLDSNDFNSLENGTIVNSLAGDVYEIRYNLDMELLNQTFGFQIKQDAGSENDAYIELYILIINTGIDEQRVFIQLEPEIVFLTHINAALKWMVIFLQVILVIWLFKKTRETRKLEEANQYKANMYMSFGLGFMFGLGSKLIMEIAHYYDRDVGLYLFPQERLGGIPGMFFTSAINSAIPTVIFLMCLLGAFVGFSYVVEKLVTNKKPIITVNLIIAAVLLPLMLFLPELWINIIFLYGLASLLLAAGNIFVKYLKLAASSVGNIRKQALYTLIGLSFPIIFQILEGFDYLGIWPYSGIIKNIIAYGMTTLGLILFYKAMKIE